MNFDRNWTIFALDAEVEAFGTSRIASAHNKLRAEVAALNQPVKLSEWQELVAERDRLRAELAKHQESEFHPDWSMLEATMASLREHMEIIRGLRAELAEWDGKHAELLSETRRLRAELAGIAQEGFAWQSRAKKAEDERDRLRELLRDIHTYGIDGLHVGHPLRNRIDAELAKEKKE